MNEKALDNRKVESLRREYSRRTLQEKDAAENPIDQFNHWFREALNADLPDANAMMLATASANGHPSARIILLKGFDRTGFRFYSNYESRKAKEIQENPRASLCFFWSALERQVRIEGTVEKLSNQESTAYFKKRPRQSQLSAWASFQSAAVESRETLVDDFKKMKQKFKDKEIPRPDFWGGYLLCPSRVEFWQGRRGRLHDRILYAKNEKSENWAVSRLSP